MTEWEPIETAPTDKRYYILVGWADSEHTPPDIAHYSKGRWYGALHGKFPRDLEPTHWMPLPDPPVANH